MHTTVTAAPDARAAGGEGDGDAVAEAVKDTLPLTEDDTVGEGVGLTAGAS